MTRALRIAIGLGLICGALGAGFSAATGVALTWVLPILLGLGMAAVLRLRPMPAQGGSGKAWPGQVLLASGGWLLAAGLWAGVALPVAPLYAGAAAATGALAGLWGLARVLRQGAPSLAEAEMTARAARLGATVTLQAALIGGLMDFLDILPLSGAQVGLCAATLGLLCGATANAVLTARAGY